MNLKKRRKVVMTDMGYITYKQADSRWGSRNYNGSSTMATAGCGPTAVAMLAYAVDGKTTPIDTMKYMQAHGYAVRNHGTAWDGIPACMKAFGLENVADINVSTSMAGVWAKLKDGYCAVFLFSAGTRQGITWTSSGHYVAVTGYKYENGKHWLYTRDSGGRDHTGWYSYDQMRGLIPKVWVGKVPESKKGAKGIDVSDHQKKIIWKKVKKDGITFAVLKAGYGQGNPDVQFERNIKRAIKLGLDVYIYWFAYSYTTGMATKEADYCAEIIAPWKDKIKAVFFDWEYDSMRYAHEKHQDPSRKLITDMTIAFCKRMQSHGYKAGFYYNYDYKRNYYDMDRMKPYLHWYALYQTEKLTDVYMQQYSNAGRVDGITTGNVDMDWLIDGESATPKTGFIFPERGYYKKGDTGSGVEKVQKKLNKVGIVQIAVDGIYGTKTEALCKEVQKNAGIKADGLFGKQTLKACNQAKKQNASKVTSAAKTAKADKIVKKAVSLAYAYGVSTKLYAFVGGTAKKAYKEALDKIFPKHTSWKKDIRTGASCSVFVAATVRATVDTGLVCDDPPKMMNYLEKSSKWSKVNSGIKPTKDLKPGDIIAYEKKDKSTGHGGGHILLYKGDGYICEANYARCYPHTAKLPKAYLNEEYIKNTYKRFGVYRIKE